MSYEEISKLGRSTNVEPNNNVVKSSDNNTTQNNYKKISELGRSQTFTVEEGSFGKSIGEFITGNEREARFNPQNLPEFSSAVVNQMSPLDPMKTPTKLGLATTFDQEAQQQIIEKQFPSAEFKDVGDGYMQIDYDGKQYVLNKAGLSTSDIESVVGTVVPFGKAVKGVQQLRKSIPDFGNSFLKNLKNTRSKGILMLEQMLGQGGTEALLQTGQMAVGRENLNKTDIGIAAGVPLVVAGTKGLLKGATSIGDDLRGTSDSFNQIVKQRVSEADKAAEETGIPLFRGQKTKRPSDVLTQEFTLGQQGSREFAEQAIEEQDVASKDAVKNLLNKLAPSTAVETGEQGIVDRSKDVIERARLIRKEKASPLYDQAIKVENPDVNIEPIENYINDLFEELPTVGQAFDQISRIQKIIKSSKKKDSDFGSIKKLHSAKFEIDKMLKAVGDDSLDKKLQQNVLDIKDILLNQLDSASPNYKLAREIFAENTPEVERLEKSLIGSFAKYEVEDLNKVSDKIFGQNQNLTNVGQVKRVKEQILSVEGGKDAWSEILRVKVERGLNMAGKNAEDTNTPAYLHKALFGSTDGSREVMMEAVKGTPIEGNLRYFDIALTRAGLGRKSGSPTEKYAAIRKTLNGFTKALSDIYDKTVASIVTGGATSVKDAVGVANQTNYEKKLGIMAELAFNPRWTTEMNTLKKLNSNSKEAETLTKSIFKKVLKAINKTENKALLAGQVETRRDQE